jgi:predicted permease
MWPRFPRDEPPAPASNSQIELTIDMMSDLRYALRMLRKHPGFTTVAVMSLAVGIGANTAVFSLLNAVKLRSLPVREPGQLRLLNWTGSLPKAYSIAGDEAFSHRKIGHRVGEFSYPLYGALRDQVQGLAEVCAYARTEPLTAVTRGGASTAEGLLVSGNFFAAYGAGPSIGRPILPKDDRAGAPPTAVITRRWWERHLNSDPEVIGRTLTLNRGSFTIIGVLPREFAGPLAGNAADFYIPLAFQPQFRPDFQLGSPNDYWLQLMLRLPPDAREAQVSAALDVAFRGHQLELTESNADPPMLLLTEGRRGPWIQRELLAGPLHSLARIVALVLLIACANAASLLLARNAARHHEMAVRAALGASRWRLLRQVMIESLVLASLAAGLGLIFSWWGKAVLMGLLPAFEAGTYFDVRMDATVLAYAAGTTAATALLVGLFPAISTSRAQPAAGLLNPRILGTPRLRLGKLLVIAQVALSLMLVAGAGLMARTMTNLQHLELGFDPDRLLVFRLNAAQVGYPESQWGDYYERVRQAIAAVPGVSAVAFSDQSHLGAGFGTVYGVQIPGREAQTLSSSGLIVSDTFLTTMGIPLLRGRPFNAAATPASGGVTIVNQAFATKMFPDDDPLGQTLTIGGGECQIIGVCGNARLYDPRSETQPIAYLSYRQKPVRDAWFEARIILPPSALGSPVANAVADLDANLAVTGLTTQRELVDRVVAEERAFASLGGGLALLAVALASVGLHGLMAYHVARGSREIGLRLALGARPTEVALRVVREAALLVGAGTVLGVLATLGTARVIRSYLYGVALHDPLCLAAAVAVLALVAVVATWLPARHAARIDPMVALRRE